MPPNRGSPDRCRATRWPRITFARPPKPFRRCPRRVNRYNPAVDDPVGVTQLLQKWRAGDPNAAGELMPLVYSNLKRLAQKYMMSERPDHTLQATALVHEAFLQLAKMDVTWQDRAHFMCTAARAMRRILVDHARTVAAHKRGREFGIVPIKDDMAAAPESTWTMVAVDEALDRLSEFDPRKAEIIQLHYFGGLKQAEVAEALSISLTTTERELRLARAWLKEQLQ